jgi:hypothetical protein
MFPYMMETPTSVIARQTVVNAQETPRVDKRDESIGKLN